MKLPCAAEHLVTSLCHSSAGGMLQPSICTAPLQQDWGCCGVLWRGLLSYISLKFSQFSCCHVTAISWAEAQCSVTWDLCLGHKCGSAPTHGVSAVVLLWQPWEGLLLQCLHSPKGMWAMGTARSECCWWVGWHSPGSPQATCLPSGSACPPRVILPCVVAPSCSMCACLPALLSPCVRLCLCTSVPGLKLEKVEKSFLGVFQWQLKQRASWVALMTRNCCGLFRCITLLFRAVVMMFLIMHDSYWVQLLFPLANEEKVH